MTVVRPIESFAALGAEEFERSYIRPRVPVMFRVASGPFPPLSWTPRFLAKTLGGRAARVAASDSAVFDFDMETHRRRFEYLDLPVPEALALMEAQRDRGTRHYYWLQQNVFRDLPELRSAIGDAPLAGHRKGPLFTGFWCGGAGNVTRLHYDEPHNLFVQCYGRKLFHLLPPDAGPHLYPSSGTDDPFLSRVDFDNPDLTRFPLFAQAHAVEITLGPGDALYLPPYWWHTVLSLDMAISVNYWWPPDFADLMTPAARQVLPRMYRTNRLSRYRAAFADNPESGFIGLAERALDLGYATEALLFAGAALEDHLHALSVQHGLAYQNLEANNAELARAGAYGDDDRDRIAVYARVVDAVAREERSFDAASAGELRAGVHAFMQRVPAPVEPWTTPSRVVGT